MGSIPFLISTFQTLSNSVRVLSTVHSSTLSFMYEIFYLVELEGRRDNAILVSGIVVQKGLHSIMQYLSNEFQPASSIAAVGLVNSRLIETISIRSLSSETRSYFLDNDEAVVQKI